MPTRRQRRVAELIHRELSLLLLNETRDPRVASVTITAVDVTPDLMQARVHFSVLGDAKEEKEAQAGLQSASGFLRSQLAKRVYLRSVPELSFRLDSSSAYARRIEDILDQITESSRADDE